MDPTGANLQIYFTGLQVSWQGAYEQEPVFWPQIATELPSDTELEQYGWMDKVAQLTQWIGPRTVNALPTRTRIVTNLDWQRMDGIPRNKFLDDKLGIFTFQAKDRGAATAKLHDLQLVKIMQGTATTQTGAAPTGNPVCFDGLTMYNTAHPVDIDVGASGPFGTYSNDFQNLALTPTNYGTARANMRAFLGRDGIPLGIVPDTLIVPPQLEEVGKNIVEATSIAPQTLANGTQVGANTNPWRGTAKLLVIDELGNQPKTWYLMTSRRTIKPWIVQNRQAPQFVYLVNPNDPNVVFQKEYMFGVDARSAYDVTLPFLVARAGSGL